MSHKQIFHKSPSNPYVISVVCHNSHINDLIALGWSLTEEEARNKTEARPTLRLKDDNRRRTHK